MLSAHLEPDVHDLIEPLRRHMFGRRRTRVGKHGFDFAAEALLVELERLLALAVEYQVSIQLHAWLLSR